MPSIRATLEESTFFQAKAQEFGITNPESEEHRILLNAYIAVVQDAILERNRYDTGSPTLGNNLMEYAYRNLAKGGHITYEAGSKIIEEDKATLKNLAESIRPEPGMDRFKNSGGPGRS